MTGTLTVSLTDQYRPDESSSVITSNVLGDSTRLSESLGRRQAVHANARLQWRGEQGKTLTLTPFVVYSDFASNGLIQANRLDSGGLVSESAQTLNQSRFAMARLNGQWTQRLSADDRLEVRFGAGQSEFDMRMDQTLTPPNASPVLLRNTSQFQNFVDRSGSLSSKWTRAMDNGHQVVLSLIHI